MKTQIIGQAAERRAQRYLENAGLTFVSKNYHCHFGEIDLIMSTHDTLVFVEVRCRHSDGAINPVETISRTKIRRIVRAAEDYQDKHPNTPQDYCRFDVVAFTHSGYNDEIVWLPDAFWAGEHSLF